MLVRDRLVSYCDKLLACEQFKDYCPNGLQVAGSQSIEKIVTGVSASEALIHAAINADADAILVHHGYFWRGDEPVITGMLHQRLSLLLEHNINLLAYHLPLDAHSHLGNNVQLSKHMAWSTPRLLTAHNTPDIIFQTELATAMTHDDMFDQLSAGLERQPLMIEGHARTIKHIAWCTGAAQDFITIAAANGMDAYLSGEVSERTFHQARELGISYFAIGHHASERYGIQALGEHLANEFTIAHQFIDIDNPV